MRRTKTLRRAVRGFVVWLPALLALHGNPTASVAQVLDLRRNLDDVPVKSFKPNLSNGQFSVAMRLTLLQPGSRPGNGDGLGMLVSYGSGWHDGFRAIYDWGRYGVSFQIGRPNEKSAVEVASKEPVYPSVMHDLVCVYDGRQMRLFVDGTVAGEKEFVGEVSARDAVLQVGYGGFGVGSNRMYVEDIQFFPRALDEEEIRRRFAAFPAVERQRLEAMQAFMRSIGAVNLDLPEEGFDVLANNDDMPSELRARVRAAFWQRLCMDGHYDRASPLLLQAASRLLSEASRAAPQELRTRRLEEVLMLRAAASRTKADDRLDSLVRDLDSAYAKQLVFRSRLAAVTRASTPRIEGLEEAALRAFHEACDKRADESGTVFLSPEGSDKEMGTRLQPVRTLQRALDLAKQLRERVPENRTVTVQVSPGDFFFQATATLEGVSGIRIRGQRPRRNRQSPDASIVAAGRPAMATCFTGAATLQTWAPVSDQAVLDRLDPGVRDRVIECDLKAAGIHDFGKLLPRGFGLSNPWVDVHFDGKPLTLARWPNQGDAELQIGEVVPGTSSFRYSGERPEHWKMTNDPSENDFWVSGMWQYEWAAQTIRLRSIDTRRKLLTVDGDNLQKGLGFHFLNVLEELDSEGEFYLDRVAGKLFVIPPRGAQGPGLGQQRVELAMLAEPFLRLVNCADIVIEDVVFSGCRHDAVHIVECRGAYLNRCEVRQVGGTGVMIQDGSLCGLVECDLYSLGGGGARMTGGDRANLQSAGHMAHNCRVDNFTRIDRCYAPAFHAIGCGMVITNNTVSRSPHHAIRLDGNDQYVARNEIFEVVQEFGDQGAVDVYRDPTFQGIVIAENFFHDIGGPSASGGQAGVRLDDAISGVVVTGNVFHRSATGPFGAIHVNGGKDNVFTSNVFVDCKRAFSFTPWAANQFENFVKENSGGIASDVYAEAYPFFQALLDGHVSRNFVIRNEAINCGTFQRNGDASLFVGNRWSSAAKPEQAGDATLTVRQWIEQLCGRSLSHIGVLAQ